jgi:membrane-bound lytic murein transglycosylase F
MVGLKSRQLLINSLRAIGFHCGLLAALALSGHPIGHAKPRELGEIKKKGVIRIATHRPVATPGRAPAAGDSYRSSEFDLARKFAERLKVKVKWVEEDHLSGMLDALRDEDADLALGGLPAEGDLGSELLFSRPLRFSRDIIVARGSRSFFARKKDAPQEELPEFQVRRLKGKTVLVRPLTSSYEKIKRILQPQHQVTLRVLGEDETDLEMLEKLYQGEGDFAALDEENFIQTSMSFPSTIEPVEFQEVMVLSKKTPFEWAMPGGVHQLKSALDSFLQERALTAYKDENAFVDLKEIKKRGVLRVLTRNSGTTYFIHRGAQLGFDYEWVAKFAKDLGVRLEIIIPPDRDSLYTYLEKGKGDLIAASVTMTPERKERYLVSRSYNEVSEILVVPASDTQTQTIHDLSGETISVQRATSHFHTLSRLQKIHGFDIEELPDDVEPESILAAVGRGEVKATVSDSNTFNIELTYSGKVRNVQVLGPPAQVGWILRKDQRQLLKAADEWIKKNHRGLFYNMIHTKYFKNRKQMRAAGRSDRSDVQGILSPYDDLVKKYAKKYEFDWRLITAQMYQESRFDPNARSWMGAMGLMQVMPQTAKDLKLINVRDPEIGIHAGVKLLARYAAVFNSPDIKERDRLRFAIASYNCGLGHVLDGRALAREKKLDPNKWFGNVEKVLPLLAKPEVARRARHGYCRCDEPVKYVSEIQARYENYSKLVEPE